MLDFWVNPFAINLSLYFSMDTSGWYFYLKIHFQPISFAPLGKYTKIQVLFFLIDSILVLMALTQCFTAGTLVSFKKLKGSFPIR